MKFFRPAKGESQFRVLPATWDGANHFGFEVWTHPFVGANASTYICSEKMNTGKPCACCDEMRRMKKAGASKEEIGEIQPRQRYWYFVEDRDKPDDIPQIFDASWSQDRAITDQTVSERTGETLYIDDPDEGYDVIVKKSGSGKEGTKYTFSIDRHSSPLKKRASDADALRLFSEDNPIPSLLKFYDYEHIERNLSGTSARRDDDVDDRDSRGRGRDRDDDRDRDRDSSRERDDRRGDRDADRDRSRDRDDDDRSRDRDRDDRDRDDERPRGRGRMDDDGDRVSDRDRDSRRDDDDRDDDRPSGRDRDRDRDDSRDRDRDDDRSRGRDRDRDDRRDRDDDRDSRRDDDRGDRGRDDRDRDDDRRERNRR